MKTILSIDWDFFFPSIAEYDWQMDESREIYYESIWLFRWGNRSVFSYSNLEKRKKVNQVMHPNQKLLKNFWPNVIPLSYLFNNKKLIIYIVDSHSKIKDLIKEDKSYIIYNFDQHHDMFYHNKMKLCCDNWGWIFKDNISQYHLFYPNWREEETESNISRVKKHITSINYGLPNELITPDYIFICRSSCWTPPWSDKQWANFISIFTRSKKSIIENYVSRERHFDFKKAKEIDSDIETQMKQIKMERN